MANHHLEPIRNRVVERRRMQASELQPHPENARRHPDQQARSLDALAREVGQVGELYAYRSEKLGGALTLLDGHLRLERFPDSEWDNLSINRPAQIARPIPIFVFASGDLTSLIPSSEHSHW